MGRRRVNEDVVSWKLLLPAKLASRIELYLFELTKDLEGVSYPKRVYGLRSQLITAILEQRFNEGAIPKIAAPKSE